MKRIGFYKKVTLAVMTTCFGGIGAFCGQAANDITCQASDDGVICNGQLHIPFPRGN